MPFQAGQGKGRAGAGQGRGRAGQGRAGQGRAGQGLHSFEKARSGGLRRTSSAFAFGKADSHQCLCRRCCCHLPAVGSTVKVHNAAGLQQKHMHGNAPQHLTCSCTALVSAALQLACHNPRCCLSAQPQHPSTTLLLDKAYCMTNKCMV